MTASTDSGRKDFDFLIGRWLVRQLWAGETEAAFQTEAEVRPILGGLGQIEVHSGCSAGGGRFEAMALRLYQPERRLWRTWWASSDRPGHLDPPLEGAFKGSSGRFVGPGLEADRPVTVRVEWNGITARRARCERAVSFDGGRKWERRWLMGWQRLERPVSHLAEARRRAEIMAQEVKAIARSLPRTLERLVRNQLKFKVGPIVYVTLSRDETAMGFSFPKEAREDLVRSQPEKFFMPSPGDMRYNWVEVWLDAVEPEELRELVVGAWSMVVPKRVASAYLKGLGAPISTAGGIGRRRGSGTGR